VFTVRRFQKKITNRGDFWSSKPIFQPLNFYHPKSYVNVAYVKIALSILNHQRSIECMVSQESSHVFC